MGEGLIVVGMEGRYQAFGRWSRREVAAGDLAGAVIQAAIDALPATGGEVALECGCFPLERSLYLPATCWLHGSGRGTELRVGAGCADGIGILGRGADGATVSDLCLHADPRDGAQAGLVLDDCGDATARNLFAVGFAGHGIWLRNNAFLCRIEGCSLADNRGSQILLDGLHWKGRGGEYLPNLVSDCTIYGGGTGVECRRAIVVNITGTAVHQSAGPAFHVHDESNSVLISGCRSFQVESDAVVVERSHEINCAGNIFCWHWGHGIVLRGVFWGTLCGNNVIDSGAGTGEARCGIVLAQGCSGLQITGNAVFNWGDQTKMACGINEDPDCRNNLFAANNVNFFETAAVLCRGQGSVERDTVAQAEPAYAGPSDKPYPVFTRQALSAFIGRFREPRASGPAVTQR